MAQIFSRAFSKEWLSIWYHFAIMFEALFILTTLDAGTRVGRYLVQDVLGNAWRPLADTKHTGNNILASVIVVAGWGYFLIQGVRDPLGGINSLWPLFGVANQLLASIALCLGTTIILKMHLQKPSANTPRPRPALTLVTLLPLVWLLVVTMTAGYQKILDANPKIGFLAQAESLRDARPALEQAVAAAGQTANAETVAAAKKALAVNSSLHFNAILNAVVATTFLILVAAIVVLSVREWILLLARRRLPDLRETEPSWLPDYAIAEAKPFRVFALLSLGVGLLRELSGEAALDRAQHGGATCVCEGVQPCTAPRIDLLNLTADTANNPPTREQLYVRLMDEKFRRPNRCC